MNEFDKAFIVRLIVTFMVLSFFRKYSMGINYYLSLPILLSILDGIDSSILQTEIELDVVKTFAYKIRDKLADAISYLFVYYIFRLDKEFLYFTIYRLIGVLLFGKTRDVRWLIVCPDLMKEYMIYYAIYRGNMSAFPVVIPVKMLGEIWMHTIHDPMQDSHSNSSSQSPPVSKITGTIAP